MKYKELEMILSSFQCDKNCPYCTAKMTQWYSTQDYEEKLSELLDYLRSNGISFKYFIISGNGEPSLNSFEKLKTIKDAVENSCMFDEFRIQTSGNLFFENEKFELFKNWLIEITKVSINSEEDMQILGYKKDYTISENFKKAQNIRLNYVLLKNKSFVQMNKEISYFIDNFSNVKTVSLKTLNCGTGYSNPESTKMVQWVKENAYQKSDSNLILKQLSSNYQINDFFDRAEWVYKWIPITFYLKKKKYGQSNIVVYGGKLVDYSLNEINLMKGN